MKAESQALKAVDSRQKQMLVTKKCYNITCVVGKNENMINFVTLGGASDSAPAQNKRGTLELANKIQNHTGK